MYNNEKGITLLAALKVHINNGEEVYTPFAVSKWEQRHNGEGHTPPCCVEIGTKARRGGLGPPHHIEMAMTWQRRVGCVEIGTKTWRGGHTTPHHAKSRQYNEEGACPLLVMLK